MPFFLKRQFNFLPIREKSILYATLKHMITLTKHWFRKKLYYNEEVEVGWR